MLSCPSLKTYRMLSCTSFKFSKEPRHCMNLVGAKDLSLLEVSVFEWFLSSRNVWSDWTPASPQPTSEQPLRSRRGSISLHIAGSNTHTHPWQDRFQTSNGCTSAWLVTHPGTDHSDNVVVAFLQTLKWSAGWRVGDNKGEPSFNCFRGSSGWLCRKYLRDV